MQEIDTRQRERERERKYSNAYQTMETKIDK